jgi:hypothetical protein
MILRNLALTAAFTAALFANSLSHAAATVSFAQTNASVSNGPTTVDASNPDLGGGNATALSPGNFSTTASVLTASNLSVSFDQERAGTLQSFSSGELFANFQTDLPATYVASGSYSNFNGFTFLESWLYDFTLPGYLYYSVQQHDGAKTLSIGEKQGNLSNQFIGSLNGTLEPNHEYQWYARAYTSAVFRADASGTAGGQAKLILIIPEPTTAALCVTALAVVPGRGHITRQIAKRKQKLQLARRE